MKPFGDGMSQEKMLQVMVAALRSYALQNRNSVFLLQEGTMLRAASAGLTFPPNPKVASPHTLPNHHH